MPKAWIIAWSFDESRVYIRADGTPNGKPVWVDVQLDRGIMRLWCEYRGQAFHLEFV